MPQLNLPPFYPGQKVIYITGVTMPKGSLHTTVDCKRMACGCWGINIGRPIPTLRSTLTHVICPICKVAVTIKAHKQNGDDYLYAAQSFRPAQEQKMVKVQFNKLLEEVPASAN